MELTTLEMHKLAMAAGFDVVGVCGGETPVIQTADGKDKEAAEYLASLSDEQAGKLLADVATAEQIAEAAKPVPVTLEDLAQRVAALEAKVGV